MAAPKEIRDLVERFNRNAEAYRSPQYNETQTRREYVDPFCKCLGWDIDNTQGYAEAYKDVIQEDAIKVGGATKAPDYCFRIGGTRKFFLEAKKPAVNLKDDPAPAFQLRRYAWSGKLPLSILTDFEEFAAYDCRVKPAQTDKASAARTLYLTYTDYGDRWDEIAGIFSRDAVLKGSFDKYAETAKVKKGRATVDTAFLQEIESWREMLAKNLALRNPQLSQRELNYAVQVTIDRIIFLRMCEDRGIETYGQLMGLLNGTAVYGRLKQLFQSADDRYNSGLFYFHKEKDRLEAPDELTPTLTIDDKPLKDIIHGIYYPESPYEFSVLPAEILGQVYEQFLGKVIRLTAGHQAKVEEKPEVRKTGGVYYTPTTIVDYIVQHTAGKLLEGKTPRQASKLRVLDPACGSGSFLLGAYKHLLDWHRDWYVADGPSKHTKEIYQGPGGGWRLTTAEKKRILLNNIYGVDIDPQAVEVTKLSLLLRLLEGESHDSLEKQRLLFHERALPDLASNIKCGNSLIGPDFYTGQQMSFLDEDAFFRVNAFDWNAAFPAIVAAAGFDVVIGNPPWGQKTITEQEPVKRYVWAHYPSAQGIYDLFRPFVEKGIGLLKKGGAFGMVLPDIVLLKDYPETRRYLLDHLSLDAVEWWGMAFASAVIDAATILGTKQPASDDHLLQAVIHEGPAFSQVIPQGHFRTNPRFVFNLFLTPQKRAILRCLEDRPKLGDYCEIHEGVHSGNIREELFVESRVDASCREMYFGREEIRPYHLHWAGRHIRLAAMPTHKTRTRYANLGKPQWHQQDKILVRRTGDYVLAAVDRGRRFANNNFFLVFFKHQVAFDLDALGALLNSRLMTWYYRTIEPRRGRVFAELKIKHLVTFPLPAACDTAAYNRLSQLGAERAVVASKLAATTAPADIPVLQSMAELLDDQIERVVRQALGLDGDLDHVLTSAD